MISHFLKVELWGKMEQDNLSIRYIINEKIFKRNTDSNRLSLK